MWKSFNRRLQIYVLRVYSNLTPERLCKQEADSTRCLAGTLPGGTVIMGWTARRKWDEVKAPRPGGRHLCSWGVTCCLVSQQLATRCGLPVQPHTVENSGSCTRHLLDFSCSDCTVVPEGHFWSPWQQIPIRWIGCNFTPSRLPGGLEILNIYETVNNKRILLKLYPRLCFPCSIIK